MSSEVRAARAAFLGVERSLTGRRWAERLANERMAMAMAQRHGLPEAICRLLAAREVDLEGVPDFLEPTLRKFLPDPSHLKDMDVAIARMVKAMALSIPRPIRNQFLVNVCCLASQLIGGTPPEVSDIRDASA